MTKRRITVAQAQQELRLFPTDRNRLQWSDLPREVQHAALVLVARMLLQRHNDDHNPSRVAQGGQEHE